MAELQSTREILSILERTVGESIQQVQILGINSLKSVSPSPQDLAGSTITNVTASARVVRIDLDRFFATIDLQRTGRLIWRETAEPAQIGHSSLPTVRVLLGSGSAVDFAEPAKTKRISVVLGVS
ncbi:DNA-formamidopyrimidine glycosylase family protein [Cellulomonas composti]|uniref:Formamidopyrimidine-DNA glycosylase catalytic domain-containing protein n=1 Tax=Cellulomonas composti TaxID=266130 RepID=A0A511JEA3_9CELL|nr:DNA-formamidopyrimidine glycosylase family protein [Cellulomonas composti]GEL96119.1 hypothetical protein CCO02nite_27770 [Cellulomonas composti]